MAEGHRSPSTIDHLPNPPNPNENKPMKKNDSPKDNPLYVEPSPKCYIGIGNNPEL